ncbi:NLR family CARD domain-containing protein 4-like [Diadema setosum]|uniref:NLR family CARD domain-containing protein 4-like n=1 Tax=Diadema setosum TaxID=31175 RepID=UPI003B3A7C91
MRAGDIESNPGPKDASSDSTLYYETMFLDLRRKIDPSAYRDLGNSLGFTYAELNDAKLKHQSDTLEALMEMLCKWRYKQPPGTDIASVLKEKLRECKLDGLTDIITDHSKLPGSSTRVSLLTEEQVKQIKKELKEHYRLSRSKINVDPLDFMNSVKFDEIYTNFSLTEQSGKHKKTITYEDLLTGGEDKSLSKRILIQGEGGAGKTTLCAKIALDWCNEKILHDINLVILIPLREVHDTSTIGGIVKRYLSDSNEATANQIDDYISREQGKVLLVFDGFDEFDEKCSSEVMRILKLEQYRLCKVIVTTRPWKKDVITMERALAETYTFISVEGFDKDNFQNYIKRYFGIIGKDAVAENLIFFMENNDVIRSNMSLFPIYCAMLCLMWNATTSEEKRKEMLKLQTFSQIFENMIDFLKEHYTSKMCEHLKHPKTAELFRNAGKAIQDIGEMALEGLLNKRLSFPVEKFNKCEKSMEICCEVGVLTLETDIISRERRREIGISSFVESMVSFPHKLFQEYIAGIYVKTLFDEDRSKYLRLKERLLHNREEFRYLLYFSSYLRKELGLDIIDGLVECGSKVKGERIG